MPLRGNDTKGTLRKGTINRVLQKVCIYGVLQKECLVIDGNGRGVSEAKAMVRGRQVLKKNGLGFRV